MRGSLDNVPMISIVQSERRAESVRVTCIMGRRWCCLCIIIIMKGAVAVATHLQTGAAVADRGRRPAAADIGPDAPGSSSRTACEPLSAPGITSHGGWGGCICMYRVSVNRVVHGREDGRLSSSAEHCTATHTHTHERTRNNCFVIFINKRHAIAALFSTMPNSTEDLSPPPPPHRR